MWRLTGLLFGTFSVMQVVMAAPSIDSIQGVLIDGETIVLNGQGFTDKERERPLLWWKADDGMTPSALGRKKSFDQPLKGEISRKHVSPGSFQSYRFDHGNAGASIDKQSFDSNRAFVHRKVMDDFDITKDFALRARVTDVVGNFEVGQIVEGAMSGATARILSIDEDSDRPSLFFQSDFGTVSQTDPIDFIFGEDMTSPTGSAKNSEGSEQFPTGLLRTFNYKIIRFAGADQNNVWLGAQGRHNNVYKVTPEYTDRTRGGDDMEFDYTQKKGQWRHEQVLYKASDIGEQNGVWQTAVNGRIHHDLPIMTRDSSRPSPYSTIAQSEVSNGAQSGSWVYYDSLYIDESWHHIAICAESEWSKCTKKEVQIPVSWKNDRIEAVVNLGVFDNAVELFFYVVDKDGVANSKGYRFCPECPTPINIDVK
ncbi:hypothetical protein ABIE59_000137 [Marinobacter sp. MBR-99]|jgi:hypothetical protein|uniref:hypothetical protein n=1 Tax=Marinobacter sp. MBR-99 TaxID=3156461 RepID=UPI003392DD69